MEEALKGKKMFWNKSRTFVLFVLPGLSFYIFFAIVPIIMGIRYSFTDWNGFSMHYNNIGLNNYFKIFSDSSFLGALNFTFRYTFALIVLVTAFSLLVAVVLNSNIKARTFFRALFFFPAVLSMLTLGLIFNQIYFRVLPAIAKTTGISFLNGVLSSPNKAFWGVLFVQVWQGIAIPTVLFLASLQTIPIDQIEAATVEGAGSFKIFTKIKIPYLFPTLTVVLILTLKAGILVFDNIMAMTEGGPAGSTISVAFIIYRHGFAEQKFSYSIAESIFLGIIICLISALQIKINNRKKVNL